MNHKDAKTEKKKHRLGIHLQLTLYLAIFTILMLVVIYLFQVVFLNDFYKSAKLREMENAVTEMEKNIDSEALADTVESLSRQTGACIRIFDSSGRVLLSSESAYFCTTLKNPIQIGYMILGAEQNNGTYIHISKENRDGGRFGGSVGAPENIENMVYTKIGASADGEGTRILMIHMTITPLDATTQTILQQLHMIAVAFIAFSILAGLILAKTVSDPIARINRAAKALSAGEYDGAAADGYREIAELNDTLKQAAKELSRAEDLRRELIANVSHDLRTPLTMIKGYSEAMRDIPGENTPENVQVIIDETERLSMLVNDILSLSRLQSGNDKLDCTIYDVTESVEEIVRRYDKMKTIDGYTIRFEYGEHVTIKADAVKMGQVIYNLVNNAIHYTGEDRLVTVRQTVRRAGEKLWVRFDILDTGAGIAAEDLPYIWDRYYKENKAHKRPSVGTGLGLSIVKGILEMHGASYGVETSPAGSDFWFEIPAEAAEQI